MVKNGCETTIIGGKLGVFSMARQSIECLYPKAKMLSNDNADWTRVCVFSM
jgi:hypothetical protein